MMSENSHETCECDTLSYIYTALISIYCCRVNVGQTPFRTQDSERRHKKSFYTAVPSIYMENGDILLSPDPANKENIYIHNKGNWGEFYDTVEESYVSLVINHNADINKLLRFIEFNSIVRDNNKNIDRTQTITAFKVTTEHQDSDKILFSSGKVIRRFDKWRAQIPRDKDTTNRLRSTHFILTLYFDNTYNKEIILNRIISHYDIQIY